MPSKRIRPGVVLTGRELKFAAKHKLPVYYTETYFSPFDRHMNFNGPSTMTPARVGFYIGNADINPADYKDDEAVCGEFPEGTFSVKAIPGQVYK